jgi:hypothetical protein
VKKSSEDSVLHILQPKRVKNAFENENKESNLFHLFAGHSLFEAILEVRSAVRQGPAIASFVEFLVLRGLEPQRRAPRLGAMSVVFTITYHASTSVTMLISILVHSILQ